MKRISEVHGINSSEKISIAEFHEFLFKTIVPIKGLMDKRNKPLEKILAFWRRNELLPFVGSGNWLRISFAQFVWIRILDDLRDVSFPVEKMKMVCDYFFKDAYFDHLPKKNYEYNKKLIKKKITAGTQTEEDEAYLSLIEASLEDEVLMYVLKYNVNYLSNLLLSVIASEQDGFIYIFFDGTVAEFVGEEYVGHKPPTEDFTKPYIHLSVSHYLKEIINDEELSTLLMPQLLNEDEVKVLREMRRKNVKEIIVSNLDKKDDIRIDSKSTGILSPDDTQRIKQIFGLKNYQSITIHTRDKKTLSFEMTRKKI